MVACLIGLHFGKESVQELMRMREGIEDWAIVEGVEGGALASGGGDEGGEELGEEEQEQVTEGEEEEEEEGDGYQHVEDEEQEDDGYQRVEEDEQGEEDGYQGEEDEDASSVTSSLVNGSGSVSLSSFVGARYSCCARHLH